MTDNTQPPNLQIIATTWQKMMGDPANLVTLTFGEMDDFLREVFGLVMAEELVREMSIALSLDIARFTKNPTVEAMIDVGEKMLRTSAVRLRLNDIAQLGERDD